MASTAVVIKRRIKVVATFLTVVGIMSVIALAFSSVWMQHLSTDLKSPAKYTRSAKFNVIFDTYSTKTDYVITVEMQYSIVGDVVALSIPSTRFVVVNETAAKEIQSNTGVAQLPEEISPFDDALNTTKFNMTHMAPIFIYDSAATPTCRIGYIVLTPQPKIVSLVNFATTGNSTATLGIGCLYDSDREDSYLQTITYRLPSSKISPILVE